jgi:hypothetical protein
VTDLDDPIAARRAQITRWCATAKRAGYAMVLLATIAFFVGLATSFSAVVVDLVVGGIAASGLLLIPALIFGYGVKAAESEERGEPFRH